MENSKYKATIGLEIHAELKTKTKMFCSCKNDPDEEKPNSNICPVCTAQPGTLPVLNKEAIEHVLKVGLACGSDIADFTEWDRKHYFYPDIPKGYQLSQYKYPLVTGGSINNIKLTRIHLEEDTASSTHHEKSADLVASDKGDFSLVDFNRSGVPLMELVTEPEIHSGKEAADFAKELQLLLQYLGVGDANMEKGEMRVEANISVSSTGKLGTKVEIKNLNSFRTVERSVTYEIERQIDALEKGERVVQETRGWDEDKQKTFSQRLKESSHDYRYFPDPDIPKMIVSEVFDLKKLKKELPELPWSKRIRYKTEFGMKEADIDNIISSPDWYLYFEEIIGDAKKEKVDYQKVTNYFVNDYVFLVSDRLKKDGKLSIPTINPLGFVRLIGMAEKGEISSRVAKDVLKEMYLNDNHTDDPKGYIIKKGLLQTNNEEELRGIIDVLISENPKVVADYKAGKEASLQFFVGQAIKATKGSANPQIIKKVLISILSK